MAPQAPVPAQPAPPQTTWWLYAVACVFLLLIFFVLFLLATADGRRNIHKLFHLTKNFLGVDVGPKGVIQLLLYLALPAAGAAFVKGIGAKAFDWWTFWIVFLTITVIGVVSNLVSGSTAVKRLLGPQAGRVWRDRRKIATAGILKRLGMNMSKLREGKTVPLTEARQLLRDLLDLIVLHVRDHRGSFKDSQDDVFASLLLDAGSDLIVVARDNMLHSVTHERQTPKKYPKTEMLCARAIQAKKPLSIGMLEYSYPEGPKNKPYKSILAIPLFASTGENVYGVLSIDSTRPYFFESFTPGAIENELENSLQPYAVVLTLILEFLVDSNHDNVLKRLSKADTSRGERGG